MLLISNLFLLWKINNTTTSDIKVARNLINNFPDDIQPVSLTEINKKTIAFVDYKDLYFLDIESQQQLIEGQQFIGSQQLAESQKLIKPTITFEKDFKNKQVLSSQSNFQPTAVCYDQKAGLLYIANFNLHDVLIAKIDDDLNRVRIVGDITDPDLVSPENVVFDEQNGLVVIADYDKSGIFVFDMNGLLKWKKLGLSMAHGVDIYHGNIYVSLFGETKLIEYDENGNLQKEVKDIGFGLGQYLYPTNIETIPDSLKKYFMNGELMILDARTGSLTVTDANLKPLMKFGENGPEEDKFNLPYGLLVTNSKLVIGDSYKRRVVIYDPATKQNQYITFKQQVNIGKKPKYGIGKSPYIADELAPSELKDYLVKNFSINNNVEVKPAFQTLAFFLNGDRYFDLLLPFKSGNFGQDNRPTFGFGFSWTYAIKKNNISYIIIGSNDRNEVIVLDLDSGFYDIVNLPGKLVVWGPLEHNKKFNFAINYVINSFRQQMGDDFSNNLKTYGGSHLAAYVETVCDNPSDYRKLIDKSIYTNIGKQLMTKWLNGEDIKLDINQYFKNGEPLAFDELYILRLMSETSLKELKTLINV